VCVCECKCVCVVCVYVECVSVSVCCACVSVSECVCCGRWVGARVHGSGARTARFSGGGGGEVTKHKMCVFIFSTTLI
jgi:hypothetical protein